MMKKRYLWAFVWVVIWTNGCALKATNIHPAPIYDFGMLNQMAWYAQAAYSDADAIRTICRPAYSDVRIQTIAAINNQYFLATSTVTRSQLLSIAGTANLQNVLIDADIAQVSHSALTIPLHRGFAKAAQLIYDDVKPHLKAGYSLQITGHSLGGASAVIVAMLLQKEGKPATRVITFGQPKVTTDAGVAAFLALPLTRVVNEEDIVPVMPPSAYRHIGPELVLFPGKNYSVVQERPFKPKQLAAAWEAVQRRQTPDQLPDHYIANTIINLDSKITAHQLIDYP